MTYKKDVCSRCRAEVVAYDGVIRPLCVDCARIEKMEMRRAVGDLKEKDGTQRHCNYCGKPFESTVGDLERLCPDCRED